MLPPEVAGTSRGALTAPVVLEQLETGAVRQRQHPQGALGHRVRDAEAPLHVGVAADGFAPQEPVVQHDRREPVDEEVGGPVDVGHGESDVVDPTDVAGSGCCGSR